MSKPQWKDLLRKYIRELPERLREEHAQGPPYTIASFDDPSGSIKSVLIAVGIDNQAHDEQLRRLYEQGLLQPKDL